MPRAESTGPGARPAVKICGVTRVADAELAVELGAAYIGLNFWSGSPRVIDVRRAREIAAAVRGRAAIVGVFVNATAAEIMARESEIGLDRLQFSGDETAADVAPFAPRAIKAFRAGSAAAELVEPYADAWAWLFDAAHPSLYGGTGASWDFTALPLELWQRAGRRVFLAGGIGPGNARKLLTSCRPNGLDVCSKVESSPGIKDAALLRRLFEEIEDVEAEALS